MPRIREYGEPIAVRFKKRIEKELAKFCIDNEVKTSTVIHNAVECFLNNKHCVAKRRL